MKRNYFIIQLLILLVYFSLTNCNKFEDGRNLSIRTVKGKLVKGSPWVFEKLEVDGVDQSAVFMQDSAFFEEIRFNKTNSRVSDEYSFALDGNYYLLVGNYQIQNKNEMTMQVSGIGDSNGNEVHYVFGPIFQSNIKWKISRLTINELEINTDVGSTNFKLFLKSN